MRLGEIAILLKAHRVAELSLHHSTLPVAGTDSLPARQKATGKLEHDPNDYAECSFVTLRVDGGTTPQGICLILIHCLRWSSNNETYLRENKVFLPATPENLTRSTSSEYSGIPLQTPNLWQALHEMWGTPEITRTHGTQEPGIRVHTSESYFLSLIHRYMQHVYTDACSMDCIRLP